MTDLWECYEPEESISDDDDDPRDCNAAAWYSQTIDRVWDCADATEAARIRKALVELGLKPIVSEEMRA